LNRATKAPARKPGPLAAEYADKVVNLSPNRSVNTVAAITPAICLTVTELITGKEAVAARLQEISAR